MKSYKGFPGKQENAPREDVIRKAAKLAPNKKSGKDKHFIYGDIDDTDDDADLGDYKKRESILDYFDDEEPEDE